MLNTAWENKIMIRMEECSLYSHSPNPDSLIWYFFCGSLMVFLSCVCYVFVRVCLYVLCGHLLGKGWPLGSRLWCLTVSLSLSHGYPGSRVVLRYLIVSIPDHCTLTYLYIEIIFLTYQWWLKRSNDPLIYWLWAKSSSHRWQSKKNMRLIS